MLPEKSNVKLIPENATAAMHERAVLPNPPQKKCGPCHTSCLRCSGPSNFQCTECTPESIYRENAPNETYCDPGEQEAGSPKITKLFNHDQMINANGSQVNHVSHKSIIQQIVDMPTFITAIIYILSVTIIIFIVIMVYKTLYPNIGVNSNSNDKKNYAYNRIAYDGTNEHIVMEQELMIPSSDSSEDVETNK